MREMSLGPMSPRLVQNLHQLALLHSSQKQYEQAGPWKKSIIHIFTYTHIIIVLLLLLSSIISIIIFFLHSPYATYGHIPHKHIHTTQHLQSVHNTIYIPLNLPSYHNINATPNTNQFTERLYQRALDILNRAYGEGSDHPEIYHTQNKLAW